MKTFSKQYICRMGQWALLLLAVALTSSCDKFLDITPTGRIIAKTGEEYRNLLTYEYKYFPSDRGLTMVRSDELTMSPAYTPEVDYDAYFDLWRWKDDNPSPTTAYFNWRTYYHAIYISNYIIEHQHEITQASPEEVRQLVGESYMMRAYSHFILANLYAAPYDATKADTARCVPLQLGTDLSQVLKSSTTKQVYAQVLKDIDSAAQNLNVDTWQTGQNYRFNKLSAQCLRARVCLYMKDWNGALKAAEAVIAAHPELEDMSRSGYVLPNRYDSKESIVAMERIMPKAFMTIGRPSDELLAQYRSGDQRRTGFFKRISTTNVVLLKGGSEAFNSTFRSAEFYLTAAEAASRLGQKETALRYLSALMQKRYNSRTYATYYAEDEALDGEALTAEILRERERELSFEGHRWFDLRRTTMPALTKQYKDEVYALKEGDSRYTMRFPAEASEANPDIVQVQPAADNVRP